MSDERFVVVRRYSSHSAKNSLLKVGSRKIKDRHTAEDWAKFMNDCEEPHKYKWFVITIHKDDEI